MEDHKVIRVDFGMEQQPEFDYEAYEARAIRRFRRANFCAYTVAGIESLVTLAIGAFAICSMLTFLTLL
jgi:hypothetical protein